MLDHRSLLKDAHDALCTALIIAMPSPMPPVALITMLTVVIHDDPRHPVEPIKRDLPVPHSSQHHTPLLPLIVHDLSPIHISRPFAGIEARSAAEVEQAEEPLQCTPDAAAASIYFPYFLYVERRRPRAPPASGSSPDPLVRPLLGLPLTGDMSRMRMTPSRPIRV